MLETVAFNNVDSPGLRAAGETKDTMSSCSGFWYLDQVIALQSSCRLKW